MIFIVAYIIITDRGNTMVIKDNDKISCIKENNAGTQLFSCGNEFGVISAWDLTTEKPSLIKSISSPPIQCMAYDEHEEESRLFISTKTEIKIVMPTSNFDIHK